MRVLPRKSTRWRQGGLAVFCLALLASLGVHLPVYEVLGKLAEVMLHSPPAERSEPVELELAPLADAVPAPPATEPAPVKPTPETPPPPKKKREREVRTPKQAEVRAEPKLPLEVEEVPAVPVPVQPPPPAENPLAVTQKSADPNAEAPENARFIAEENQRVEQETIARTRNMHRDDPEPTPSASKSEAAKEEVGDAPETDVADLQEVRGSNERPPTLNEAEHKPAEPNKPAGGEREGEAVAQAAEAAPAPSRAAQEAREASAPAATEPETMVVQDSAGSFTIRKQAPGPHAPGTSPQPGQPATEREAQAAARESKGAGVNLKVTFSQFESTFGADELREQREAYLEQRRSQVAGGPTRQQKWRKFRAAIENFVPNVQPGEQSALNTAASPFADYLAQVHRRIHREFAHRFLGNLPIAGGPFDDRSLHAELEIVINGDGSVHQVGVAQTSGFLPFDYGAFDSVMRAGPYPVPPRKILSGDGRVYFHWGFYRNERQCGTFNARPYILPHPKGTPGPAPSPLQDRPEQPSAPPAGGHDEPAIYDGRDGELGRLERAPALRPGAAAQRLPARHVQR